MKPKMEKSHIVIKNKVASAIVSKTVSILDSLNFLVNKFPFPLLH